ncbi:MAG TPA: alpha/beta fold hydrolase, partial [Acidimicrobiales bacterium]|nr:alpha/beta fold hydrolase [Acidimicrobiales bacterium]
MTEVALAGRDGLRIVAHELGGTGTPALFVHGTGFNALSFRPLAELLAPHFRCIGVDLGAHGRSGRPDSLSWYGFVDDVVTSVTGLGIEGAIGIGHSMGATALLSAASKEPLLFSFLYCYEPIVISPEMPDGPPDGLAEIARRRRSVFETRQAANERLSSRPPFSTFDPGALAGYLEGGLVEEQDGSVRLACLPED